MNVYKLYYAEICVLTSIRPSEKLGSYSYYYKFVKNAILYKTNRGYYDIVSGERYCFINEVDIGDLFVNLNCFEPLNNIDDIKFERKYTSKRKVLKEIARVGRLYKKEDDK